MLSVLRPTASKLFDIDGYTARCEALCISDDQFAEPLGFRSPQLYASIKV
jgi:hypothetical protein